MGIEDRIGVDLGATMPLEDGIRWAGANGIRSVDIRLGDTGNAFASFSPERLEAARRLAEQQGVEVGLHTLSAVNVAEFAPYLDAAVDDYLFAYVDIAAPLGASSIVVHAGYHFTDDYARRRGAALDRLRRLTDYARTRGVTLLLENMNPEPLDAEVRYLAHNVEECRYYFDQLDPEVVRWSFTVNHAHMIEPRIPGFFAAFGAGRLGEVRLADNRGTVEEHLFPGEGSIDFAATIAMIEAAGYRGRYTLAFGTPDDMLRGRKVIAGLAGG
jgi:sugar phosphate isomerase/epimerase